MYTMSAFEHCIACGGTAALCLGEGERINLLTNKTLGKSSEPARDFCQLEQKTLAGSPTLRAWLTSLPHSERTAHGLIFLPHHAHFLENKLQFDVDAEWGLVFFTLPVPPEVMQYTKMDMYTISATAQSLTL